MVLQPSDERRRSGSHYTPRTLTEPIVSTTFRPILERLGPNPTPEQILDLKVCDPAMGSGAFLVEACRAARRAAGQGLARPRAACRRSRPTRTRSSTPAASSPSAASTGWTRTRWRSTWPSCRSGWRRWRRTTPSRSSTTPCSAATRWSGSRKTQILGFHWKPEKQRDFARAAIEGQLNRAMEQRRQIREAPDGTAEALLRERLAAADGFLEPGTAVRRPRRLRLLRGRQRPAPQGAAANRCRTTSPAQRSQFDVDAPAPARGAVARASQPATPDRAVSLGDRVPRGLRPRESGVRRVRGQPAVRGQEHAHRPGTRPGYPDWLKTIHEESHGNADLVAHFFRRAFNLLGRRDLRPDRHEHHRPGRHALDRPALDLQARRHDLRSDPAQEVAGAGGRGRQRRPRRTRGRVAGPSCSTAGRSPVITAYLFHAGGHDDPAPLQANAGKSFRAATSSAWASPSTTPTTRRGHSVAEMHELIAKDPATPSGSSPTSAARRSTISPTHAHHRYVINFGEMTEEEAATMAGLDARLSKRR